MYRKQMYIDTTVGEKIISPLQLTRKHINKLFLKTKPMDIMNDNKNRNYEKNHCFYETMYDLNGDISFCKEKNKRNKNNKIEQTSKKFSSLPKINYIQN